MPRPSAVTTKRPVLVGRGFHVLAPMRESPADGAGVELERVADGDEREGPPASSDANQASISAKRRRAGARSSPAHRWNVRTASAKTATWRRFSAESGAPKGLS